MHSCLSAGRVNLSGSGQIFNLSSMAVNPLRQRATHGHLAFARSERQISLVGMRRVQGGGLCRILHQLVKHRLERRDQPIQIRTIQMLAEVLRGHGLQRHTVSVTIGGYAAGKKGRESNVSRQKSSVEFGVANRIGDRIVSDAADFLA